MVPAHRQVLVAMLDGQEMLHQAHTREAWVGRMAVSERVMRSLVGWGWIEEMLDSVEDQVFRYVISIKGRRAVEKELKKGEWQWKTRSN